jgi:hypothetical protein
VLHGLEQHSDGSEGWSGHDVGDNMSGNAEGAVGMKGFGTGMTMRRFEGASDEQQEDTQDADQQPRGAGPTASRQRF